MGESNKTAVKEHTWYGPITYEKNNKEDRKKTFGTI